MVAIRLGDATIGRLEPEKVAVVKAEGTAIARGRFSIASWHLSKDIVETWADFHLRTAGHFLDTVSPGTAGDPDAAANIVALRRLSHERLKDWDKQSDDWQVLLARASRHATPKFVAKLLGLVDPASKTSATTPALLVLGTLTKNLRHGIEAMGPSIPILEALKKNPAWAQDRGLADHRLLRALGLPSSRSEAVAGTPSLTRLEKALAQGSHAAAVTEAIGFAGTETIVHEAVTKIIRLSCATLDTAAAKSRRLSQWLATEAYLGLAIRICGDKATLRDRISHFYRARAEEATARLNLTAAVHWLTAAYWIGQDRRDKAFLADTLAELAIIRFRADDPYRGRLYLNKAQDLDPHRPRVLTASEFNPQTDPRARVAVTIIIFFLAIFAWRRLKRALFGDLGRRRR
jgi:hypothetical protein